MNQLHKAILEVEKIGTVKQRKKISNHLREKRSHIALQSHIERLVTKSNPSDEDISLLRRLEAKLKAKHEPEPRHTYKGFGLPKIFSP